MPQFGYILFGWLLGILSMLIARWIQTKEEKKKKEAPKRNRKKKKS